MQTRGRDSLLARLDGRGLIACAMVQCTTYAPGNAVAEPRCSQRAARGYALIDIWRKMLGHAYGGSSLSGCKLTGRKLPHAVCVPSINAPNYDARTRSIGGRRKMLG